MHEPPSIRDLERLSEESDARRPRNCPKCGKKLHLRDDLCCEKPLGPTMKLTLIALVFLGTAFAERERPEPPREQTKLQKAQAMEIQSHLDDEFYLRTRGTFLWCSVELRRAWEENSKIKAILLEDAK